MLTLQKVKIKKSNLKLFCHESGVHILPTTDDSFEIWIATDSCTVAYRNYGNAKFKVNGGQVKIYRPKYTTISYGFCCSFETRGDEQVQLELSANTVMFVSYEDHPGHPRLVGCKNLAALKLLEECGAVDLID